MSLSRNTFGFDSLADAKRWLDTERPFLRAEFLFQLIAERAEKAAVIVTTNLPFSEWTQVVPNPRLCKALLDRITDRAHIIETGTESYRFRRTLEKRKGQSLEANSNTAPPPADGDKKKGT